MYTSCFEREKELGECSNEHNSFNSDMIERNISFPNSENFFNNKHKKIPIKIILSENEEVISTENNTEPFENNTSGNNSPSPLQNFTENFIRFSNTNINNFTIGKIIYFTFF